MSSDNNIRNKVSSLQALLQTQPDNADALTRLGAIMFEPLHDTSKAIRLLESAVRADPERIDSRFWLAKCLYHDYVDLDRARKVLEDAISIKPDCADCLSLLASVLADLGQPPATRIMMLRQAVDAEPTWLNPRQQLVEALLDSGQIDSAAKEAQIAMDRFEARELSGDDVADYYEWAVTGRGRTSARDELSALLSRIEALKLR